tara:strand:- start:632 stop:832 length:201 start_codon:yes stop_codon:yes gene_type:complete
MRVLDIASIPAKRIIPAMYQGIPEEFIHERKLRKFISQVSHLGGIPEFLGVARARRILYKKCARTE